MPKKLEGGTIWDFSTFILSQNIKEVGPFGEKFIEKKSMPKITERGSFGLAPYCMLRGKKATFIFQFLVPKLTNLGGFL